MSRGSKPGHSALLAIILLSNLVWPQAAPPKPAVRTNLIYSVKGPDLFRAHCAACHGVGGRGDGPVARALKVKPPDLTTTAQRNGGRFPAERIRKLISGDEESNAHGSREMPIWGPIFHQVEWDRDWGRVRLENLVKYLQSIQK
jgi:mono/diheme cytochrome c family protein